MKAGGNARAAALRVLIAMENASAWADAALSAQISRERLSPQDAALATKLTYGVLQNRLLLDEWISHWCRQRPDHLQTPLPDILRLGVYQIAFLDKIPESAAVNESVILAKQFGMSRAAGLVNAVLRQAARHRSALPAVTAESEEARLSIVTSHPKWLVERLMGLLGREEAEAFLRADNESTPLTVQANTLKTTPEALLQELRADGITASAHPWIPGCLELTGTGAVTALPAFREGRMLIQDGAASLAILAAGPEAGQSLLDVCAAPGGKSFRAAVAMGDRGRILACDLHENKLRRIREGAERLGITSIETAAADGREHRPEWDGAFDLVVVDAPCSGLGIIRKKPEIRYKNPSELSALPPVQGAILQNAASYVRPGGTLLYSTCTILPEENQQVTDAFLAANGDFSRSAFSLPSPVGTAEEGQITLWPQRHGTDGFYICRMQRR